MRYRRAAPLAYTLPAGYGDHPNCFFFSLRYAHWQDASLASPTGAIVLRPPPSSSAFRFMRDHRSTGYFQHRWSSWG